MTTTVPSPVGTPGPWRANRRRYLYACAWLVYLANTANGVHRYQTGWAAVAGYVLLAAFVVGYVVALIQNWAEPPRPFVPVYAVLVVLWLAETLLAREDAGAMAVFLVVLAIARWPRSAVPVTVATTAVAAFGPALVPGWHAGVQEAWLFTIPLVAVAMWAFFTIIRANRDLNATRMQVAQLAAENERTRIARDLHDLLGHSLTTITVKAGLARRLAERGQADRALVEISAVETLSRSTLADVRAAISGQHDIRLVSELATARELLRAAGIAAELPGSVDIVEPGLSELFGWVVREGITNVVRHSRAGHCTVTLGPNFVEITDDGRGAVDGTACGNGLTGLRERVAAAGGAVRAGGDGRGWQLRVEVPPGAGPDQPPGE